MEPLRRAFLSILSRSFLESSISLRLSSMANCIAAESSTNFNSSLLKRLLPLLGICMLVRLNRLSVAGILVSVFGGISAIRESFVLPFCFSLGSILCECEKTEWSDRTELPSRLIFDLIVILIAYQPSLEVSLGEK